MIINADRTFTVGDDGQFMDVTAPVTLTIPNDTTHNFLDKDEIFLFKDSNVGVLTIALEEGVELRAKGTKISQQYGYAILKKMGNNCWMGWGDLI